MHYSKMLIFLFFTLFGLRLLVGRSRDVTAVLFWQSYLWEGIAHLHIIVSQKQAGGSLNVGIHTCLRKRHTKCLRYCEA